LSPIVVITKKNGKLRIYIDWINIATKKDPYPLFFIDEMLNIVARYEAYSVLDGYLGYHEISITLKDKYKIAFVTYWGASIWKVMPFGVKNEPPTYQKDVTKAFKKYLDNFMKIFLDGFTIL